MIADNGRKWLWTNCLNTRFNLLQNDEYNIAGTEGKLQQRQHEEERERARIKRVAVGTKHVHMCYTIQ